MITEAEARRNVATNVVTLLEALGMTQRDLAHATGLDDMKISRICRGLHDPGTVAMARIAKVLHTSIDKLLEDPKEFSNVAT